MTDGPKLDAIDRRILEILQEDASLPIHQLGERVGLSANPCWRRVKQLERDGVIQGRVALVNGPAVGLKTSVFVSIRTGQHNVKWLDAFARAVRQIPEIMECHRMSGEVDYLLKIVVRDIEHYDEVYKRLIALTPGLVDVSSTFSMERLKYETKLPLSTCE